MFNDAIRKREEVLWAMSLLSHDIDIALDHIKFANKVLLCGNGGSAADCLHLAAELMVRYKVDREPIAAIALLDVVNMTACANDFSFNDVFSRQVRALGGHGDVLIAITTSGESKNVLDAIDVALEKGMVVIVLTGSNAVSTGGNLSYFDTYFCNADLVKIAIPSNETAIIQEMHQLIYHYWCECIDKDYCL